VLATLGLFFTLTGTEGYRPHIIEGYRIFNRVMAILLVCAIAAAGGFLQTMRERVQGRVDAPSDPDQTVYYQMLQAIEKFVVIAVSAASALAIFALDVITPTAFNASILYGLPLLLFMAAHSFRVLWSALFVLVVLAWLGFVLGPQEGPEWLLTKLCLNRVLVTVALFGIAFIGHMWGRYMQKKDEI